MSALHRIAAESRLAADKLARIADALNRVTFCESVLVRIDSGESLELGEEAALDQMREAVRALIKESAQ